MASKINAFLDTLSSKTAENAILLAKGDRAWHRSILDKYSDFAGRATQVQDGEWQQPKARNKQRKSEKTSSNGKWDSSAPRVEADGNNGKDGKGYAGKGGAAPGTAKGGGKSNGSGGANGSPSYSGNAKQAAAADGRAKWSELAVDAVTIFLKADYAPAPMLDMGIHDLAEAEGYILCTPGKAAAAIEALRTIHTGVEKAIAFVLPALHPKDVHKLQRTIEDLNGEHELNLFLEPTTFVAHDAVQGKDRKYDAHIIQYNEHNPIRLAHIMGRNHADAPCVSIIKKCRGQNDSHDLQTHGGRSGQNDVVDISHVESCERIPNTRN